MKENRSGVGKTNKTNKGKKYRKTFDKREGQRYPAVQPEGKDVTTDKDQKGIPWRNDYRFYAVNDQIAKDVANLPFNYLPGTDIPIPVSTMSATDRTDTVSNFGQQGVMRIGYTLAPGRARKLTDGANVSARQLYAYIRRANSGARNYEAPDIAMYIHAMREIYAFALELKRAIGVVNNFQFTNRSVPNVLLAALGIDEADLRANLATYRGELNILISQINSLAVPSYFKMFDRTAYITSKVFADSDSMRGQFYVFALNGYRKWSGTASTSGTSLQYTTLLPANNTFKGRLSILNGMVQAIFTDEDAATMSGDILKAFGSDKLYQLEYVPDNYVVMPVFDEDVLAQIENAVSYDSIVSIQGSSVPALTAQQLSITQDSNKQVMLFNPTITIPSASSTQYAVLRKYCLNSHKDTVDYTDVLEWTRCITMVADDTPNGVIEFTFGLEFIMGFSTYKSTDQSAVNNFTNLNTGVEKTSTFVNLMQFDWHPAIYMLSKSDKKITNIGVDIKKVTYVTSTEIAPMHDSAALAAMWADELYKSISAAK